MTEKYELSRRKTLAGLATIGAAGAGAGLGTSALFNDTEEFTNNSLTAGELDLIVDYATYVDQGEELGTVLDDGTVNGEDDEAEYSYVIEDVKPGDSGKLVFCPKIVDNPSWLWTQVGVTDYENGQTEPEAEVDESDGGSIGGENDGEGDGELSEYVSLEVSYVNGYEIVDDSELVCGESIYTMDVADLSQLEDLGGFRLDGEPGVGDPAPYPDTDRNSDDEVPENGEGPCLCVDWEVPIGVGNEIQTDAVDIDFSFYAQQYRHNEEDPENPFTEDDDSDETPAPS